MRSVLVRIQNQSSSPRSYWNGSNFQNDAIWLQAQLDNDNWHVADVDFNSLGEYRILVRAYDNNDNQASASENPSSNFNITDPDTTPPTLTITSPVNDSVFSPQILTVEGLATDDSSGVSRVLVRIQNQSSSPRSYWNGSNFQNDAIWLQAQLNDNSWQLPEVDFNSSGKYRILVRAYDNTGNHALASDNPSSTINISTEPDTTPPTVTITSPVNDSVLAPQILSIEGVATDNISGVNRVLVRIQNRNTNPFSFWNGSSSTYQDSSKWNQAQLDANGEWQVPDVNFNITGDYRVLIRAYDTEGNQAKAGENPQSSITIENTNN